jgi:hypothetical protein
MIAIKMDILEANHGGHQRKSSRIFLCRVAHKMVGIFHSTELTFGHDELAKGESESRKPLVVWNISRRLHEGEETSSIDVSDINRPVWISVDESRTPQGSAGELRSQICLIFGQRNLYVGRWRRLVSPFSAPPRFLTQLDMFLSNRLVNCWNSNDVAISTMHRFFVLF